jgi:hypothetical protein
MNILNFFMQMKDDNFEAYMQELGVNTIDRVLGRAWKQDSDHWKIRGESMIKNVELNFKPGVEFDDITVDGRHVKVGTFKEINSRLMSAQKTTWTWVFLQ